MYSVCKLFVQSTGLSFLKWCLQQHTDICTQICIKAGIPSHLGSMAAGTGQQDGMWSCFSVMIKQYFLISRKQNQYSLSKSECQICGRHTVVRQNALPWRNISWFSTQGRDGTPRSHYDHQTLNFPGFCQGAWYYLWRFPVSLKKPFFKHHCSHCN